MKILIPIVALSVALVACGKKAGAPKADTSRTASTASDTSALSRQLDSVLKSSDSVMSAAKSQLDSALPVAPKQPSSSSSSSSSSSPSGLLISGADLRSRMGGMEWQKQRSTRAGQTSYSADTEVKGVHTHVSTTEQGDALTYVRISVDYPMQEAALPTLREVAKITAGDEAAAWIESEIGSGSKNTQIGSFRLSYEGGSRHALTVMVR